MTIRWHGEVVFGINRTSGTEFHKANNFNKTLTFTIYTQLPLLPAHLYPCSIGEGAFQFYFPLCSPFALPAFNGCFSQVYND